MTSEMLTGNRITVKTLFLSFYLWLPDSKHILGRVNLVRDVESDTQLKYTTSFGFALSFKCRLIS